MKLGIIGTAKYDYTPEQIAQIIASSDVHPLDSIIIGKGKTLDAVVKEYCVKALVPVVEYAPNFSKYGKAAAYKRNCQIIKDSDKLLLIWDGKSEGCRAASRFAKYKGKPVLIHKIDRKEN